jgi:fructoselysine-6-P-deglycase FrlB-like protein
MTDTLPLKPIEENFVEKLQATVDQFPAISEAVSGIVDKGLRNVFFVGAGGSIICSYPAAYILQHQSSLPVWQVQSDEFNTAPPALLGEGSLVILASYTGTTKETVQAAKTAKDAGATVAVAAKSGSPLAEAADFSFTGGSDAIELLFAYALLKATGVQRDFDAVQSMLNALPNALLSAQQESEDVVHEIAEAIADEPIVYVLGSGPSYAWAYGLAMCYLQEMQWKHAAGFNSGEFFQGAFEMVTDDTAVLNLLGEDASRPMAERAQTFLDKYTKKNYRIDVKNMSLPGVPSELRHEVSPLAVAVVIGRLAKHLESVRGHDLETRRYMFKVEY